ncbi:MAG: acetolactate synthase small subunit [Fibromonadaceae bacterium]|jgi:acetolactate synthase-1/3 small subunit|nr:acetolactate synthase small subunit [Fibromonadaceae bacterium]
MQFPAHSISILVSNKPAALARIALVFSRRGYNIDSLVVSPTIDHSVSRMNIVARGNPEILAQIIQQLEKLIDVIQAKDHTSQNVVEKELALLKVRCKSEERTELLQICDHFKAITIDMTESSMIIQVTGYSDKIEAMLSLCKKFDIVEFVRTGKIIMMRGESET